MDLFFKRLVKLVLLVGFFMALYNGFAWRDHVNNPANSAYVLECAFNLDIPPGMVTQKQFNQRYNK